MRATPLKFDLSSDNVNEAREIERHLGIVRDTKPLQDEAERNLGVTILNNAPLQDEAERHLDIVKLYLAPSKMSLSH
jgi:hypothetical protein